MRLSCGALILLAAATSASAAAGKRARVASATEIRKQQLHHAKSTNPEVEGRGTPPAAQWPYISDCDPEIIGPVIFNSELSLRPQGGLP